MKIALFTDSFLPGKGGTENAISNLVVALQDRGEKVRIYCPDYHQENQNFKDFSVFRVKSLMLTKNEMIVLPSLQRRQIENDVKNFDPDLLYFCSASGMAKTAVKLAKKLKKPLVATIHTKFHYAFYNSSKSRLLTHILIKSLAKKLNHCDCVTTVSNDMATCLKEYGYKGQPIVIRNGLKEIPKYTSQEKSFDKYAFLFCGHVIKIKNIQFSLKCLAKLKCEHKFDNFVFNIAGSGNYQKKLEKLAKKLNIFENVNFLGYISDREELNKIYSQSHLMLFPSYFDNDGLVVLESASNSTPTLALKGYGCGERIIDNETGFLAEYDEEDFANRLWKIINDKETYNFVRKNMANLKVKTWDEISKEYIECFQNVISNFKQKKK